MSNIYQLKRKQLTKQRRDAELATITLLLKMNPSEPTSDDLAKELLRLELANMLTQGLINRIKDELRRSGLLRQSASIQKTIDAARRNLAALSTK